MDIDARRHRACCWSLVVSGDDEHRDVLDLHRAGRPGSSELPFERVPDVGLEAWADGWALQLDDDAVLHACPLLRHRHSPAWAVPPQVAQGPVSAEPICESSSDGSTRLAVMGSTWSRAFDRRVLMAFRVAWRSGPSRWKTA